MSSTRVCSVLSLLEKSIERLTPLGLAGSWDNVGLLAETPFPRPLATRILLCIDLNSEVCNEALSDPETAIVLCYHPIIFSGLKKLTLSNPLQSSVLRCIASGVSIFCIHTAADNASNGVNDFLAEGIIKGQGSIKPIKAELNPPVGHESAGTGRIATIKDGVTFEELIARVKATLGLQFVQAAVASSGTSNIRTVAICAGSGSGVLKDVDADVYLTGELGHHEILAAQARGIHVIVCNHSATERPWLTAFAPRLELDINSQGGLSDWSYQVIVSNADAEPLRVY